VIAEHGLAADKRLGQNFLLDLNLTGRIARAAGDLTQGTVIEIGPGPGGLTRALLLAGAGRVVAIERDRRCVAALAPLVAAAGGRLSLIEADALTIDASALGPPPRRIVANLPYNVGTALTVTWLRRIADFAGLTLMFQREVAERLVAAVGEDGYGRLAVLRAAVADARILFDIDPRAFTPPPKVTSSVVSLTPLPTPTAVDLDRLARVTQAAFGQRRKMLRQSLRALGGDGGARAEAAGLPPTARAEEVPPEGFFRLAEGLAQVS
jgi:16S rRNA (adenine1518-N6/adenine1519-N6)-dimethyltransferase